MEEIETENCRKKKLKTGGRRNGKLEVIKTETWRNKKPKMEETETED